MFRRLRKGSQGKREKGESQVLPGSPGCVPIADTKLVLGGFLPLVRRIRKIGDIQDLASQDQEARPHGGLGST